jgi:hypothetical protein
MFTRRRFLPTVDVLCSRIAPSAIAVPAPAPLPTHSIMTSPTRIADTDLPMTGSSSPTIMAPTTTSPPTSLLC